MGGTSLLGLAVLAALANFAVLERLVVDGDAIATTKAIAANEQQFGLLHTERFGPQSVGLPTAT